MEPDLITARDGTPYMERYYIKRSYEQGSIQLHHLLTDDPEPDMHDHPWDYTLTILTGGYREITPEGATEHHAPSVIERTAETPHRLELLDGPTWTLVRTGPVTRKWGYHTQHGWIPWRQYRGR